MQRLAALLAVTGIALAGVAMWLYNTAASDRDVAAAFCRVGDGVCSASIAWTPIVVAGTASFAALVAAWFVNRSVVRERTEQLVD